MNGGSARILIAECEDHLSGVLEDFLRIRGHAVTVCRSGREALQAMQNYAFDLALVDIVIPEMDGLDLLRQLNSGIVPPELVVIASTTTIDTALAAVKAGAFDYVSKPYRMAEIDLLVRRALEHRRIQRENALFRAGESLAELPGQIVTHDPELRAIVESLPTIACDAGPVLVTGERGTGKRLVAMHSHRLARTVTGPIACVRADRPSVHGIECDLFGGKRDVGGGRVSSYPGAVELAAEGTLVIREVTALSEAVQLKLLAALDNGWFTRPGGRQQVGMQVRVIATSCVDVDDSVDRGTFNSLLAKHLSQNVIALPSLRGRTGDVQPLLAHFVSAVAPDAMPVLADDAIDALEHYAWPGNVAELETVVAHLALVSRSRVVRAVDLPLTVAATPVAGLALGAQLADLEREHIQAVLRQTRWHRGRAAAALGISSKTLYRKIREYGFVRPSHS